MTASHDSLRLSVGAYLLGALEPADRAEVETHLAGCPECREAMASLAGVPGLLGRLTAEEAAASLAVGSHTEPDQGMLKRALTEMTRRRRRQRRRWLLGAAAAVLIAAGGSAAADTALSTGSSNAGIQATLGAGRTITATNPATHVHATVTLSGEPAGTAITVTLAGVTPGLHCQLIAVATNGQREVAASWRVNYEGHADVTGTTSIPTAHLDSLQVITTAGTRLVAIPVHR